MHREHVAAHSRCMSKKKPPRRRAAWEPVANPDLADAMRELRRSSAAGPHGDRRTKRLRDRAAIRRAAVAEQRDER